MGPPRAAWKEVGVLRLARCELHQLFDQEWRQRYGALLVRFGGAQHSLAVLVHGPCFRYPCPSLHEVQTGDAECQGFVDAEAGIGEQVDQGAVGVIPGDASGSRGECLDHFG
jgi:hypothetical protein